MQNYTETDQTLHLLCQVLAKANRTYLNKQKDDSHTNLYFDSLGNRITSRWIPTGNGQVLFTLNLNTLSFECMNRHGKLIAAVSTISNKVGEIEQALEQRTESLGLSPTKFSDKLHFEIPTYEFASEPIQKLEMQHLKLWGHMRALANTACMNLLGHAQAIGEIRIWPHHFDTGIFFKPNDKMGIGFGLAMEDKMVGAPYFYMSGYPETGSLNYKNLPDGPWRWEIGENWKGVYLSLAEIVNLELKDQKALINSYLVTCFKWFVTQ